MNTPQISLPRWFLRYLQLIATLNHVGTGVGPGSGYDDFINAVSTVNLTF